jgi:hypothetical protein
MKVQFLGRHGRGGPLLVMGSIEAETLLTGEGRQVDNSGRYG